MFSFMDTDSLSGWGVIGIDRQMTEIKTYGGIFTFFTPQTQRKKHKIVVNKAIISDVYPSGNS